MAAANLWTKSALPIAFVTESMESRKKDDLVLFCFFFDCIILTSIRYLGLKNDTVQKKTRYALINFWRFCPPVPRTLDKEENYLVRLTIIVEAAFSISIVRLIDWLIKYFDFWFQIDQSIKQAYLSTIKHEIKRITKNVKLGRTKIPNSCPKFGLIKFDDQFLHYCKEKNSLSNCMVCAGHKFTHYYYYSKRNHRPWS